MVECLTSQNTSVCMASSWACSGHPMCVSFDVKVCEPIEEEPLCEESNFVCHLEELPERKCISYSQTCDNVTDCFGREDESHCSGNMTLYPVTGGRMGGRVGVTGRIKLFK